MEVMLAGAPLDTGNRGVEALGRSALDATDTFAERTGGPVRVTVLDNGWGQRPGLGDQWPHLNVSFSGVRRTRRVHRPEAWSQIAAAQRLAPRLNPVAERLRRASAMLDISGGDSFTDLYGAVRLATVSEPKLAALRAGTPLVLLPQTYGPFHTAAGRELAVRLVRSAALAYARDPLSHARLLDLAGDDADLGRCRSGVDIAFALQPRVPLPEHGLADLGDSDEPLAGMNISGLLTTADAHARFGLAGDYLDTMTQLGRALIADGARVILIPHVHIDGAAGESDLVAIERFRSRLTAAERRRTRVIPPRLNAAELKWCISRLDWMVGSRMHATIASLSSGVATFGYAYSDKTIGVFETCDSADTVADARRTSGPDAVEAMLAGFHAREERAARLAPVAAGVVERSRGQLVDLLTTISTWSEGAPAGRVA